MKNDRLLGGGLNVPQIAWNFFSGLFWTLMRNKKGDFWYALLDISRTNISFTLDINIFDLTQFLYLFTRDNSIYTTTRHSDTFAIQMLHSDVSVLPFELNKETLGWVKKHQNSCFELFFFFLRRNVLKMTLTKFQRKILMFGPPRRYQLLLGSPN